MKLEYQGVRFTESLPRINETRLRKVERQFEARFPEEYRAFLLAVNGGIPSPLEFNMAEPGRPGERVCVDFFYGIGRTETPFDLAYQQLDILERTDTLPDGFVVIGHDPGSAPFFIGTEGDTAGVIYFYDPSGFLDPEGQPRLYVAARSFSDLLRRMAAG